MLPDQQHHQQQQQQQQQRHQQRHQQPPTQQRPQPPQQTTPQQTTPQQQEGEDIAVLLHVLCKWELDLKDLTHLLCNSIHGAYISTVIKQAKLFNKNEFVRDPCEPTPVIKAMLDNLGEAKVFVPGTNILCSNLTARTAWLLLNKTVIGRYMPFIGWIEDNSTAATYPQTKYCRFTIRFGNSHNHTAVLYVPSKYNLYNNKVQLKKYMQNMLIYLTNVKQKAVYHRLVLKFNDQLHIKRLKNSKILKDVIHDINKALDSARKPAGSVVTNVSGSSNTNMATKVTMQLLQIQPERRVQFG